MHQLDRTEALDLRTSFVVRTRRTRSRSIDLRYADDLLLGDVVGLDQQLAAYDRQQ